MAEFKDFDKALEADKQPLQIKVAGKTYELPATLPARTVLAQMKYANVGDTIPMEIMPEWIASLVGQDKLNQMLEDGMTWEQMNEVLGYLLEVYGLTGSDSGESKDTEEDSEDDPK